jgi:alpha-mannosidase
MLLRGVNGIAYVTTHIRPQTGEFIELRAHRQNTVIFPGGLPFFRRHENRMLDLILVPQNETAQTFDLGIALDREYPAQTALGFSTPVPLIATEKGPPHVGASGWLFHLDTPHLLMTSMRPGGVEQRGEYGGGAGQGSDLFDAVTVRLFECASQSGQAEFRCARDPRHAAVLNARGDLLLENNVHGDAVSLEVTPNDFNQLQIEFS